VTDVAEHPLLFLAPLALGQSSNSVGLSGSAELALAMSIEAIDAGRIGVDDVATALKSLHHDLGFADAAGLVDHLTSFAMSEELGSDLPLRILAGMAGKQTILGTASSDPLTDGSAGAALLGRLGDDVLDGGGGNDWMVGGRGNDTLRGGDGADRYLYGSGDGDDFLYDIGGSGDLDRLVLGAGIAPEDVTLIRSTDLYDLSLSFAGGGSVLLNEQFRSSMYGIDYIDFADGTSWSRAAILDLLA
jgi:Ca2+-binding RTX toxin-like protein